MEYIAESKNVKVSPRKIRLVAEGVKKMPLERALLALQVLHKRAATPVRKTLESAIANAVNNHQAQRADLAIDEILVNEGIRYKRYHFGSRGRIKPYKKRASHIRVVLSDKKVKGASATQATLPVPKVEPVAEKENEKKETKTRAKGGRK